MTYKSHLSRIIGMMAVTLLAAPLGLAQVDSTYYLTVDCMKSTSPDYVDVEQNIWKPMHQELVHQGRKNTWALYGVRFGSRDECDYYTVSTFVGSDAMQSDLADLPALFAKVHPEGDFDEAMAKTQASRTVVRTELWMGLAGIRPENFRFAQVNLMWAEDGAAYVDFETRVFKPVHQALVDAGVTRGWQVAGLLQPGGTGIGYNFATVDFLDELGGIPFGDYLARVHPDLSMEEVLAETAAARDLVSSQVWVLIAGTELPE